MADLSGIGRPSLRQKQLLVAIGDVVVIVGFVAIGELRHAGSFQDGLTTSLQFLGGWAFLSLLTGVYRYDDPPNHVKQLKLVVISWAGTVIIVQLIRTITRGNFLYASTFLLVAFLIGGLGLLVWRGVLAFWFSD